MNSEPEEFISPVHFIGGFWYQDFPGEMLEGSE